MLKRWPRGLDLLLAGTVVFNSIPGAIYGQAVPKTYVPKTSGNSKTSDAPGIRTSKPGMTLSQKDEALILKAQSPLDMPHVYHPWRISSPFTELDPITRLPTCKTEGYAIMNGYLYEGVRGGERQFEIIVGLDQEHIHSSSGITKLEIVLCSTVPTSISEDIFELNVNEYDRRVTYSDITQLKIDQDMFSDQIEKFPDLLFKLLRVSSTEKGFTKSLVDLLPQISRNEQIEADVAQGNAIMGDRVYGVWYTYNGKGKLMDGSLFDEDVGAKRETGRVHRAPKVIRFHFKEGGKHTKAVIVRVKRIDYLDSGPQICTAGEAFAFDVERAFRDWSVVK